MPRADEAAANDGGISGARGFESGLLSAIVDGCFVLLAISASSQGLKAVISQYGGLSHYTGVFYLLI